jgi:DNA gyrase subunit B
MTKEKEVNLVSKDSVEGIHDDTFIHLADEITSIREAKTMYIPGTENTAALHLLKEIFNNSLDELNNPNSIGNTIYVEFYKSECKFVVTDNGRGIPIDIISDTVMKKHVSTKFMNLSDSRNKKQTGIHGIGSTVVAALTDYESITTYRGDHSKTIEIIDGELKEGKVKKLKKEKHGLSTTFIPSEKYLGELTLTNDMVEDFIRKMSYIMEDNITIKFTYEEEDGSLNTIEYKALGLSANLEYLSTSMEFPPINIKYESDMFDLFISFSYDKTIDDPLIESYANYVITTESGTHEMAAQRAICEFFSKEAKRLDPTAKYDVSYDDCKKGLVLVVNLEHVKPEFEGQHKSKVSNKDVITEGKKGLVDSLSDYFSKNNALIRRIISYLRQISRIRQEANKIKGVTINKKPSNFIDDSAIKGFFPITDRKYNGYTEIYFGEGDSAVSALLAARNSKHQALLGTMGVVDNTLELTLDQLMTKQTFRNVINVLGCGIGKDFDITKLRYNKIILAFDADVDGSNITSLFLCFFFVFMPEIILQGKLYRAIPPLYLLEKKSLKKFYSGREWLYDKKEYYNMYNNIIASNVEIALEESKNKKKLLKKNEALDWLYKNAEYKLELDNLGKKATCDTHIVEYVTYYKILSDGDEFKFKKYIEKEFPEMTYDILNSSLVGSYNGNYISLICDRLFMKSAKRFINEIKKNVSLFVYVKNKNDKDDLFNRMTIGEFYTKMYKEYSISIEQRFKG